MYLCCSVKKNDLPLFHRQTCHLIYVWHLFRIWKCFEDIYKTNLTQPIDSTQWTFTQWNKVQKCKHIFDWTCNNICVFMCRVLGMVENRASSVPHDHKDDNTASNNNTPGRSVVRPKLWEWSLSNSKKQLIVSAQSRFLLAFVYLHRQ
jgi:hypothetical protein